MAEANDPVEQRVVKLERWVGVADQRLAVVEKNFEKLEKKLDTHREGQIVTQTLVEVGNKKTDDLAVSFLAFRESEDKRREDERKDKERAEQESILAAKARQPNWWIVGLTAVSGLVGIAGVVVAIIAISHGGGKP